MKVQSLWISLSCFVSVIAFASESHYHSQHLKALQGMNPSDVNGYTTDKPDEAAYSDNHHGMEGVATQTTLTNPHAQILLESAHKRPFFALDPKTDPMITHADEAIANPEQTIRTASENTYIDPEYEEKICEESKPTFQVECTKTLKVSTLTQKQRVYSHSLYSDTQYNKIFDRYEYTPHLPHDRVSWHQDGNWHQRGRINIYYYESQELQFDEKAGTSTVGDWQRITLDQFNQSTNDLIQDEWIDSCAYLKDHETLKRERLKQSEQPETTGERQ